MCVKDYSIEMRLTWKHRRSQTRWRLLWRCNGNGHQSQIKINFYVLRVFSTAEIRCLGHKWSTKSVRSWIWSRCTLGGSDRPNEGGGLASRRDDNVRGSDLVIWGSPRLQTPVVSAVISAVSQNFTERHQKAKIFYLKGKRNFKSLRLLFHISACRTRGLDQSVIIQISQQPAIEPIKHHFTFEQDNDQTKYDTNSKFWSCALCESVSVG